MEWRPPDAWSYSYLLGMYLGDGCISANHRTFQLVVVCDAAYPTIIEDCWTAMTLTLLPRAVHCNPHAVHRCVRVVLVPWQHEIVDRHPREFLRGLLHSDGCRTINRFTTRLPSGRVAESAGRNRTRATSRSPTGAASRC